MVPQIAFNKVYEPVVYGTRGKPYLSKAVTNLNEVLNKEVGTGNRLTDDVLDLFCIWLDKRKAGQDYLHPTEKPVTLHEKPLRRCTRPGGLVLDTFGGSGSTLIACEQMKRRAFLLEIDPVFCDVIIDRWQILTGQEVQHVN
jgi:DNA modification methylase